MQERRRTPETGCYQGPQPESQAQPYAKGGKCTGSPGRVQLLLVSRENVTLIVQRFCHPPIYEQSLKYTSSTGGYERAGPGFVDVLLSELVQGLHCLWAVG